MKQFIICCWLLLTLACNTAPAYPPAQDPLDAAREFLSATLGGDFKKANAYMLHNAENEERLQAFEKLYNGNSEQKKVAYRQASLEIREVDALNDSTTIINYRNSYDRTGHKVKVIKSGNNWLVDFTYTFDGNL
jgi:hypothetical protein